MGHYFYHRDKTKEKYSSLISQLHGKRETFCGIGTRKAKIRLNKLAKTDTIAALYRKALEIEDKNIQAKAYPSYREEYYEEKSLLIEDLIKTCLAENIKVGYSCETTEYEQDTIYIVYFELPNCEQISWHCTDKPNCPVYDGVWDGKVNSTLPKLEKAILSRYPEITV